jgi:osmotically inducible protein OsmC
VKTTAKVQLDQVEGGFAISKIELTTQGTVPGIDAETFLKYAEDAKKNCPVSKALAAVDITLNASLG